MITKSLQYQIKKSPFKASLFTLYSRITLKREDKIRYKDMISNCVFSSFCRLFFEKSTHFSDLYLCLCEPELKSISIKYPNQNSAKFKIILAIEFLAILIENDQCESDYLDKLRELLPLLTNTAFMRSEKYNLILEPETLPYLHAPKNIIGRKISYYLKTDNSFISTSIMAFVNSSNADTVYTRPIMAECLSELLMSSGVETMDDVTPEKYIELARKVTVSYNNKGTLRIDTVIGALGAYIKYCIRTYKVIDEAFNRSQYFSIKLLTDGKVKKFLKLNYEFMTLDEQAIVKAPERVIFIRRNLDRFSTKTWANDYFSLDMSGLDETYRKAIITWGIVNQYTIRLPENLSYIAKTLRKLQEIKKESNSKKDFIKIKELLLVAYDNPNNLKSVYHDGIYTLKLFFHFAEYKKLLHFEKGYMLVLSPHHKTIGTGGHSAEKEWIREVDSILYEKAKDDESCYEVVHYVAFRLNLVMPLRISQIMSLKTKDIHDLGNGKYIIMDESKTSHGNPTIYSLTAKSAELILYLIKRTEEVRKRCTNHNTSDFIFLYWSHGYSEVKVATKVTFRKYLERPELANDKGEYLSARLLRCTILTNIRIWCEKNKVDPFLTNLVTCHSNDKIVFENYYDYENAGNDDIAYEITGNFNNRVNIDAAEFKSELIKEAFNPEECEFRKQGYECPFTCLICENFIATTDFIPYFKKQIKETEKKLLNITDEQKKQQLMLMRELYIQYINALEEDL